MAIRAADRDGHTGMSSTRRGPPVQTLSFEIAMRRRQACQCHWQWWQGVQSLLLGSRSEAAASASAEIQLEGSPARRPPPGLKNFHCRRTGNLRVFSLAMPFKLCQWQHDRLTGSFKFKPSRRSQAGACLNFKFKLNLLLIISFTNSKRFKHARLRLGCRVYQPCQ